MGNKCNSIYTNKAKLKKPPTIEEIPITEQTTLPVNNHIRPEFVEKKPFSLSQDEIDAIIANEEIKSIKIIEFTKDIHPNLKYRSILMPPLNDEFLQANTSIKNQKELLNVLEFHKSMKLSRSLIRPIDQYAISQILIRSAKINKNIKSPYSSSSKKPLVHSFFAPKISADHILQDSMTISKLSDNNNKQLKRSKVQILQELEEIKQKYFKLDYQDLELLESLSDAANALQFKAFDKKTNEILAIKFLTFEKLDNESWENHELLSNLLSEKKILEKITSIDMCPFLLLKSLYESDEKTNPINNDPSQKQMVLITEYGRASLSQLLHERQPYTEKEIAYILFNIITGLYKAQEQLGISHRNISTTNIIAIEKSPKEMVYKLGNFNCAIRLNPDQNFQVLSEEIPGVIEFYTAPEFLNLFDNDGMYNPFKADVFSMGIVILEMMGYSQDDIDKMRKENFINLSNKEKDMKYPLLLSIVREMLQLNPENRLDWQSIMLKFGNIEKILPKEDEALNKLNDRMSEIIENNALKNYEDFCKLYFDLGQWKKTVTYIDLALELLDKRLNDFEILPNEIRSFREQKSKFLGYKAIVSRESGQITEAFELHNQVLEILKTIYDNENHVEIANTYEGIGLLHKLKKNYKEALKHFELALSINKVIFGENDIIIAQLMTEIGLLYKILKDYTMAIEVIEKALEVSIHIHGDANIFIPTYYSNIGSCYQVQGIWDMALQNYEKALEIRLAVLGERDDIVAYSYISIAKLYEDSGDINKAIENHQKALEIRKNILGEHENTAYSYIMIGNLYQEIGDLSKSLEFYKSALDLRVKLYGDNNELTCVCYNNLGRVCQNIGKVHDALDHHQKALSIRRNILGLQHFDTSFSLLNVGIVYQDLGNYPKAIEFLETSVGVRIKLFGEYHINTAICLVSLGNVYYDSGQYQQSLELHDRAWKIRIKALGENHPFTANSYTFLAQIFIEMKIFQKANGYCELAYKILKEGFGDSNVLTCLALSTLGYYHQKTGNLKKALEIMKNVLKLRIQLYGKESRHVAVSYHNIGVIYKEMKLYEEALEYHTTALQMRIKLLGEYHPETAQSYESSADFNELFKRTNKEVKEYKDYKSKAENIKKSIGIVKFPVKF